MIDCLFGNNSKNHKIKKRCTLLLIVILLIESAVFASPQFGLVQASTDVSETITSDTTWTMANSPYMLNSSVKVDIEITLTIEPGVIIDLNNYPLQVNGVLIARGSSNEKISFNNGQIDLTSNCTSWNEQTGQGTIIENSIINRTSIAISNSPKIINNIIYGVVFPGTAGVISIYNGSPNIINNTVYVATLVYSIHVLGGSPIIAYNTLNGGIGGDENQQTTQILNNVIMGEVIIDAGCPIIANNIIIGFKRSYPSENSSTVTDTDSICGGIGLTGYNFGEHKLYNAVISNNTINGCRYGICWNAGGGAIIEGNSIINCAEKGLLIGSNAIIRNNLISNTPIGIEIFNFNRDDASPLDPQYPPTIFNNDFENITKYIIYSYCCANLNMTYNWWGTTDTQTINQKIYDHMYDSSLGIINFIPFSTAPNTITITIEPTLSPTTNSTPTISPSTTPYLNGFLIESNSTVSAFSFNNTPPEILFTVSGPNGTKGYIKLSIAKTFMPNADAIKVYLDGNQTTYNLVPTDTAWIIAFSYSHSEHQVIINSIQTANNLNVPDWIWNFTLATVAIALGIAVVIIVWVAKNDN